jgi:hypothetical protein
MENVEPVETVTFYFVKYYKLVKNDGELDNGDLLGQESSLLHVGQPHMEWVPELLSLI